MAELTQIPINPDLVKVDFLRGSARHSDIIGKRDTILSFYEKKKPSFYVNNSFYYAWVNAYNNHLSLRITPEQIMNVVNINFSKFVCANAEKLRHMFVNHEGKEKLTVTTPQCETENEWQTFFKLMSVEIEKKVKGDIIDIIKNDFSTSDAFDSIFSIASTMATFKEYFEYGRCIPLCGLKNVYLEGTVADYEKIISKLNGLKKYGFDYVDKIIIIVNKFIESKQGNIDKEWWNKVMNFRYGRYGSGSTPYISGWFVNFFGLDETKEYEANDITLDTFYFPVKVINYQTLEEYEATVSESHCGVTYENDILEPHFELVITKGLKSVKKFYP